MEITFERIDDRFYEVVICLGPGEPYDYSAHGDFIVNFLRITNYEISFDIRHRDNEVVDLVLFATKVEDNQVIELFWHEFSTASNAIVFVEQNVPDWFSADSTFFLWEVETIAPIIVC